MNKKVIIKNFKNKNRINWTHFLALSFLIFYFLLSKLNTAYAFLNNNKVVSFLQIYLFGVLFACIFLFLFSHEKFFPLAKVIESEEEKKERKYLKKYIHHGKVLATFIIGIIGGPVFSSLTARLLLNNTNFLKYIVIILANIPSTIVTVGLANGIVKLFHL
jgi:hypothetical protein